MGAPNPYKAYNQATHTVSKTRQIVMLYDGMVRFLSQAKEAMAENRIEDRFNLLVKTANIVVGLQSSLDFEEGGEAASSLYDFYASLDARITDLHRSNDSAECDALIAEIREMRDLWKQIDENVTDSEPAHSPVAAPDEGSTTPNASGSGVIVSA